MAIAPDKYWLVRISTKSTQTHPDFIYSDVSKQFLEPIVQHQDAAGRLLHADEVAQGMGKSEEQDGP